MRTRKLAFHAESLEEFQQVSTVPSQSSCSVSGLYNNRKRMPNILSYRLEEDESTLSQPTSPKRKNPWTGFEFATHSGEPEVDEEDQNPEGGSKRIRGSVAKRFMVLGASGTGKHALIESIFGPENEDVHFEPIKQSMDLMIKTDLGDGHDQKYQFWITNVDTQKFGHVVKVYYRTTSIFFFVYSIDDRKSFQFVEESIKEVRKEVPQEKFVGVLLGTKNDLEQNREIMSNEGVLMKEKYGLSHFFETNSHDGSLLQKFRNLQC